MAFIRSIPYQRCGYYRTPLAADWNTPLPRRCSVEKNHCKHASCGLHIPNHRVAEIIGGISGVIHDGGIVGRKKPQEERVPGMHRYRTAAQDILTTVGVNNT